MNLLSRLWLPFFVFLIGIAACASPPTLPRKAEWAKPIAAEGLPNLFRVDAHLYRSANPEPGADEAMRRLGITTVIDLRIGLPGESSLAGQSVLNERIPMFPGAIIDRDVVAALRQITHGGSGSVLVHCEQGADRTGLVIALYRMVVQGWSKDAAIDEMVHGGYGFHPVWQNIVNYARSVDVKGLRAKVAGSS